MISTKAQIAHWFNFQVKPNGSVICSKCDLCITDFKNLEYQVEKKYGASAAKESLPFRGQAQHHQKAIRRRI